MSLVWNVVSGVDNWKFNSGGCISSGGLHEITDREHVDQGTKIIRKPQIKRMSKKKKKNKLSGSNERGGRLRMWGLKAEGNKNFKERTISEESTEGERLGSLLLRSR